MEINVQLNTFVDSDGTNSNNGSCRPTPNERTRWPMVNSWDSVTLSDVVEFQSNVLYMEMLKTRSMIYFWFLREIEKQVFLKGASVLQDEVSTRTYNVCKMQEGFFFLFEGTAYLFYHKFYIYTLIRRGKQLYMILKSSLERHVGTNTSEIVLNEVNNLNLDEMEKRGAQLRETEWNLKIYFKRQILRC